MKLMSLQSSQEFEHHFFERGFFSSRHTAVLLAMNALLFAGLFAIIGRRWEHFPAYYLLISAGLVAGSVMVWFRVWKQYCAIRAALESAPRPVSNALLGQILQRTGTLLHLAISQWVICAFLASLAMDHGSR
jgi:hypothetical protein